MAHNALGLTVQPDCLKGRVVCGTIYGEMHLEDILGSFVRVDLYLVLHCRKGHYNGLNQTKHKE